MQLTRLDLKANHRQQTFTNEELVAGIAENNTQALDYLYQNNFHAIKQFILKNNGAEADAHDVFQEAIIATWLNIREEKFHALNGNSLGGYLYQIARNKWLDKVRSKPFRTTVRLAEEEMEQPAYSNMDTEEHQSERIQYLHRLYQALGEKCKTILNAFYYHKKSLKEIGLELNYDGETMRTLKYRCMMKLRKLHTENKRSQGEQA